MKLVKKQILRWFLAASVVISAIALPFTSIAQGPPDSNTEIFTDPDLPLDGGVGILIAAGVAYGVKRVRDERKKKRHAGL